LVAGSHGLGVFHGLYLRRTARCGANWLPYTAAAALSALQISLFLLLVWIPIVAAGNVAGSPKAYRGCTEGTMGEVPGQQEQSDVSRSLTRCLHIGWSHPGAFHI
jgi:hypothetical protein